MKDKCTYLFAPFIFFLLFFTNIKAQILLVPEIEQEQDQWCWAAVSKCVLDCYGPPLQQCEIAEYTRNVATFNNFGTVDCCVDPNQGCNYWNYNYGASGSIEDILSNFAGIITTNSSSILSELQWQAEITNNTPVIIRFGWNNGGGHFVVGYGVSGLDYYTMDPWFNEGYTISTYNWIVTGQGGGGSWTHTQTLSSPLPTPIEEQFANKELLKITDLLGRETKGTKNEVLFYIYDDGTVEKRIIIE